MPPKQKENKMDLNAKEVIILEAIIDDHRDNRLLIKELNDIENGKYKFSIDDYMTLKEKFHNYKYEILIDRN
tara:strand:+ start:74 stop:289 length:216 start_codon:yes stop_codon:yes gene_type:complete